MFIVSGTMGLFLKKNSLIFFLCLFVFLDDLSVLVHRAIDTELYIIWVETICVLGLSHGDLVKI